ncbi:MAG: hypothetical protein JO149_08640, partial [Gammaproteobacteria bacterium]|nr:hypothetical protein [Gammaproteobacteria bacterium]
DSNGTLYNFTVLSSPPFMGTSTPAYIQCANGDAWCNAINIDFNTGHDINTQPPI